MLVYTRCYFYYDLATLIIFLTEGNNWQWVFPFCDNLMSKSRNIAKFYDLDVVMWAKT